MYGVFFSVDDMTTPKVSVPPCDLRSAWPSLSEEQRIRNLAGRLFVVAMNDGLSADEIECALNIGLMAMRMARGQVAEVKAA